MQKKDIKNIIIIFIIIFILELTIFNINSYRIISSKNSKTFKTEDFTYLESDGGVTLIELSAVLDELERKMRQLQIIWKHLLKCM